MFIVVEVAMNMLLVGSQRSKHPKNVNFEPIIRGLNMICINRTKCKFRFIYARFNCKRKKMGFKMDGPN